MRRFSILLTVICLGVAASAQAQGGAGSRSSQTYGEFVAGPTFGKDAIEASFGLEAGFPYKALRIFVEGGVMRDVLSAELVTAATVISNFLETFGTSAFTLKQPVGYVAAGLRYNLVDHHRIRPYLSVGFGGARVTKNVSFFVNGADVTDQLLETFGVQLGADLAGDETRPFLEAGLGAHISIGDRIMADASYRYGRVFLIEPGMIIPRVQFGIGVGF